MSGTGGGAAAGAAAAGGAGGASGSSSALGLAVDVDAASVPPQQFLVRDRKVS